MSRFFGSREWIAVYIIIAALLVVVPITVVWLSLSPVIILLFSIAALSGGTFGELRDTWDEERQFSLARVFFRAFEWLSLAVAGYIILSVIGVNASLSE